MHETPYCQSCGMPMNTPDALYGTEADGQKSPDYCSYCYENGQFTADITLAQMIDFCVPHVVGANPDMDADAAKGMLEEFMPKLKRWNH